MNAPSKNLINKFNKKKNLIIVSELSSAALERYINNTISSLKGSKDGQVIVLTNIITKEEIIEKDGVLIVRCFKRNNLTSLLKIAYYAYKFNKVKSILFEFEFATYGEHKVSVSIPLLLLALRLLGKKVFFAMHQVVSEISTLSKHLNLSKDSILLPILNFGLKFFYFLVGLLVNKIIVLEEEFKTRLSPYVNGNKVEVIPHGIEKNNITKKYGKIDLGFDKNDYVILAFGYIAWYKGTDELIKAFNGLPSKINGRRLRLVIAGGKSIAQKDKAHYKKYFNSIVDMTRQNGRIVQTGFVKDSDVKKYFDVADLTVYPYKTFISSSGPLSLGVTYGKNVVLSNHLSLYLKSADFKKAFERSGLKKEELFINFNAESLKKIISLSLNNKKYISNINSFTSLLLKERQWDVLIGKYSNLLFEENPNQSFIQSEKLGFDII